MIAVDLFRALGDTTRLEMVQRLSSGSPHTISSISTGLGITRQGARKHLQILANAKVVSLQEKGRDTIVHLNRQTLEQGKTFIEDIEKRWDRRLEALKKFVEQDT